MEKKLSLKIQRVIDSLELVLDNQGKLKTHKNIARDEGLYSEEHATSPFLEFSLGEDLYAILNAEKEHFYTVERTYTEGKKNEREIDDETINEILTEIFRKGDYLVSTSRRVYEGGGSVLDPHSANFSYETGEVSGVPLTTVGYKPKNNMEKSVNNEEEKRETTKPKVQVKTEQVKPRMTPYQVIAKNALMNWNGLSEEEATKKVQESTFEELESQVHAEGSITYALEGLQIAAKKAQDRRRRFFGDRVDYEPVISDYRIEELKEIVLHGGESKAEEDKIYAEIKQSLRLDIPDIWTGEDMALTVLSHIHDGWVKDNQKKFMARDKKYQHMPIELIGWKEAKADLLFLQPILSAMKAGYMESSLESAYDERVKEFFRTRGIKDISQLQGQIQRGASFYPALKGQTEILEALQDPQFVAENVIPSIQEKGVGADENAMKRLEQWRIRSSKLVAAKARKQELQKEEKTIGEAEKLIAEKENNGQSLE